MLEQLAEIAHVYVHKIPCKLYDSSKFLGVSVWSTLKEKEIRELLKQIHIINSDLLPGFESSTALPVSLSINLSEEQRNDMILMANTYKVLEDEPGSFIVKKGEDLKSINTNTVPILCKCRMANSKQVICYHILAVEQKFPASNILKKIEKYLQEETTEQRHKRLTGPSDAGKPGEFRRRRGNRTSRSGKYDEVT
uniref:SWIM-type domain-containing protein n=1 Tax=Panagrolaimus sp. ES5 TaxID=591445 RepID=A0AC34GL47_9BILA